MFMRVTLGPAALQSQPKLGKEEKLAAWLVAATVLGVAVDLLDLVEWLWPFIV